MPDKLYTVDEKEVLAMLERMKGSEAEFAPIRKSIQAELAALLPKIRQRVSVDTGRLRSIVKVWYSRKGLYGEIGYIFRRRATWDRIVAAVLEELGSSGRNARAQSGAEGAVKRRPGAVKQRPPRTRAVGRIWFGNKNRLAQELENDIAEVLEDIADR